jgi:Xaa-Pro aminopeptidase
MNYKKRRTELLKQLDENSMMILYSDKPNNQNYFYLTGIKRENMILTLDNIGGEYHEKLYIEKPDALMEKWNGKRMTLEEAKNISQIEEVTYTDGFESIFTRLIVTGAINSIYFNINRQSIDANPDINEKKAKFYQSKYPYLNIKNAYHLIGLLRMEKDQDEINEIKTAILRTKIALSDVLKKLKPGMYEYQVQADFEYSIKYQGSLHPAFDTIAGSGYNATMLHYGTNHCQCQDGDLILLDLGAESNGYCADISRTYPLNGKYTERQKQIYDIVLKANLEVIKEAKPGKSLTELNELCKDILAEGLIELEIIKDKNEISKYYMHGVGHHLGIDVHDVTIASSTVLKPGNIITDEPGLYIEEENIGIRIEDDLLITEDGCIVLSKDIIKTTEEIEVFMAK